MGGSQAEQSILCANDRRRVPFPIQFRNEEEILPFLAEEGSAIHRFGRGGHDLLFGLRIRRPPFEGYKYAKEAVLFVPRRGRKVTCSRYERPYIVCSPTTRTDRIRQMLPGPFVDRHGPFLCGGWRIAATLRAHLLRN